MKLVCPACGAVASAECWVNDSAIRYFFDVLVQLPPPVLQGVLPYLALFRQGAKSLPWRKALSLIRTLKELIETGEVHWQDGETRPCTSGLWGKAMEATLASRPKGLKNHNYLRRTAWDMAAELAAKTEAGREETRKRRSREIDGEPAPLSEATRQAIDTLKHKWGQR